MKTRPKAPRAETREEMALRLKAEIAGYSKAQWGKVEEERARVAADTAEWAKALREKDDFILVMAQAEARYRKHLRGTGKAPELATVREFIAESHDAIFAPSILLALLSLRESVRRLSGGNAVEREAAVPVRRLLEKLLLAYARPGPSRETKRIITDAKIALARTEALVDFVNKGEKITVALARHAAEVGVVTPKAGADPWTSRSAQRAEQRARKKAGEPPRPRGRPPRPR